jgi:hypothetical protein
MTRINGKPEWLGWNRKPVCLLIRNFAYNFAAESEKGISFFKMVAQLVGQNIQTQETRISKKAIGHFVLYA